MLSTESFAGSERNKMACALAIAGKSKVKHSASGNSRRSFAGPSPSGYHAPRGYCQKARRNAPRSRAQRLDAGRVDPADCAPWIVWAVLSCPPVWEEPVAGWPDSLAPAARDSGLSSQPPPADADWCALPLEPARQPL